MSNSLSGLAYIEVAKMLERGLAQGHTQNKWKDETVKFHTDKAAGHIKQHWLVKSGKMESDENHLQNALCRMAMALYVEKVDAKS